jgi:hypothetical protein
MKIISFNSPIWVNAEQTAFNCNVLTQEFGEIPFTCASFEREVLPYVDALWGMVVEDPSVEIAPFVEPPPIPAATPPSGSIPGNVL